MKIKLKQYSLQNIDIITTIMPHIQIVTSRFNNDTWSESCKYRQQQSQQNQTSHCIYGAPLRMSEKIPLNSLVFVVEMNNSTNKIEGVGLIRNMIQTDKYHKVYEVNNYNRYIYKGEHHIMREQLNHQNSQLVKCLDHVLFKEKTHLKRGSGFTLIPEKLMTHRVWEEMNLRHELQRIFQSTFHFGSNKIESGETPSN